MVDRGRAEVYAAELAAFDGTELETVEPFDSILALVGRVVGSTWWSAPVPLVRPARCDASSSTTRSPGGVTPEIRLARPQWTRATVVHELAHVLAGTDAGHGPLFRRAHIDVAVVGVGADRAGWLLVAYHSAGLAVGARTWPPPPEIGGPIAL